ncbi:unnamed protein product, partial [Medioppia subpectinata]
MNCLIQLVVISLAFTFVVCDLKDDIECVKSGANDLNGKTDRQLYDLTQTNLITGEEMVLKRAAIANTEGLPCYYQFYDKY